MDIGKDMHLLGGEELLFYKDQLSERKGRLSQQIDEDYEHEKEKSKIAAEEQDSMIEEEISFIEYDSDPETITTPTRRSSSKQVTNKSDKSVQANRHETAPTRDVKNCNIKIKTAIAVVSVKACVSVEKARVATQAVCENLYDDKYLLKPEAVVSTSSEGEPLPSYSKKPRTKTDYEIYKYVLPSAKAISSHKHSMAMSKEVKAATNLLSKDERKYKVTLHYDSTTRSRIDGEWHCIILNFLSDIAQNCQMISLRPLHFAYEDRQQIVELFVESFKRLSVAIEEKASAGSLWEKVDAVMTDAASKNLLVEARVSEMLKTAYVPVHILCKSHVCEKLDECCQNVLKEIEHKIGLREILIKREPMLKSFLRTPKSIVASVVIPALLKLVAKGGDGKVTSMADEFSLILEENNVHKSFSLYKERRFTRLGHTAGALADCAPYFKRMLNETSKNNLLTRACSLYLESEFIMTALKALSFFTYKVTMPYLNMVERCNQNDLVKILPKLCRDLEKGNLETLADYHVPWMHVNASGHHPTTDLDHYLLDAFAVKSAGGVKMQCGREYWETTEDITERATSIHLLSVEERKNLPTENLSTERCLARFGNLASLSAAHSNRFFKAKRIRDDLLFNTNETGNTEMASTNVLRNLDAMEMLWTEKQKEAMKKRLIERIQKSQKEGQFLNHLVHKCKEHGGPFTQIEELGTLPKDSPTALKKILRVELQYQRLAHPRDSQENPSIYKVNGLEIDVMMSNLALILGAEDTGVGSVFPTEDEVFAILSATNQSPEAGHTISTNVLATAEHTPGDIVAVIWDMPEEHRQWFLARVCDVDEEGNIECDHYERAEDGNDVMWRRPKKDDIQNVLPMQILRIKVETEWVFTGIVKVVTLLKCTNATDVSAVFAGKLL